MKIELTRAETLTLYYESVAWIDSVLQIWLTVTFAAIIAMYVASSHITKVLRTLIVSLYSLTAFVLVGRILMASLHASYYRSAVEADPSPFTLSDGVLSVVGPVLFLLIVVGSVATSLFLITHKRIT